MFSYLLFVLSPQVHLVVPGDRISLLYTYLCTTDYEKNKSMKKKKKKSVSANPPPPPHPSLLLDSQTTKSTHYLIVYSHTQRTIANAPRT